MIRAGAGAGRLWRLIQSPTGEPLPHAASSCAPAMLTAMCHVGAAPQCNLPQSYLARSSIGHETSTRSRAWQPRRESRWVLLYPIWESVTNCIPPLRIG